MAAILHADVAGYSRLMADDEQGTLAGLKTRLDVLRDAIATHSGRICNTAGDAVLAEFPSVSAAVSSAIDARRRITELNESVPDSRRLDFRFGINLGEVMAEDDGQVYGTGVNVAARLQGLAEPGHIAISGRAKEQVDAALGIDFVSMGQQRVKNIPNAINVFRIVTGGPQSPVRGAPRGRRRLFYGLIAAMCAGGLVMGVTAVNLWTDDRERALSGETDSVASRPVEKTRIAVLPFRNVSGDPQQDYFAEAITEDLTNALGRFAEFGVIAREALASFGEGQTTPKDIQRQLGVSYLVTGSVWRDGDAVRLVVKLVSTESGLQVWSSRYERSVGEIFAVEDEIVRTVAGEAAVTLDRAERERVFGKAAPDLEAYDLYIRGRALVARETREDNVKARDLFRRAIERDPRYALAYVGLAETHYREATRGWSQFMLRNVSEAEDLARQALQLDPDLPDGYAMLGFVSLLRGEYEQSEAELRKALELNPNSLGTLQALGNTLTFLGDAEGAVRSMERAVSLGAHPSSRSISVLGLAYVLSGDPRQAIQFLETYGRERRDHFYYATLAIAHAEIGDADKATAAASEALRAWPYFDAEAFAQQFRDPRDQRRIADDLHKAGLG